MNEEKSNCIDKLILLALPCGIIVWGIIVIYFGKANNNSNNAWNFSQTGQFGDSFGVIGAIMATAAAFFTFRTLKDERIENRRMREQDADRAVNDKKRVAEETYFQLLNLRNSILERIQWKPYPNTGSELHGNTAIRYMVNTMKPEILESSNKTKKYEEYWNKFEGELGHYVRFIYHIVKFADEEFPNDCDSYKYVRLLRAQLSNAELELIALNSMFGEGDPSMKEFIEKFSLLHNLPKSTIQEMSLTPKYDNKAFSTDHWKLKTI